MLFVDALMLRVTVVVVLLPSAILALSPCQLNPEDGKPVCEHALRYGYCHNPPRHDDERWCTWEERDVDVCCTALNEPCCDHNIGPTALRVGTTPIILISLCCCLALVCRVSAESPVSFWTVCRRLMSCCLPVRVVERWELRDRERQAGLPRGALRPFTFPDLPPLDVHKGKECVVCCEEERGTVLPCGHSLMCEKCCHSLLAHNQPCPHCRKPFINFALATSQPSFRDWKHPQKNNNTGDKKDNKTAINNNSQEDEENELGVMVMISSVPLQPPSVVVNETTTTPTPTRSNVNPVV